MAKHIIRKKGSNSTSSSGGGIVSLKFVVEKLHKKLLLRRNKKASSNFDQQYKEEACYDSASSVPEDVKEGHFAVIAEGREEAEAKRFVLPISCLSNPIFLRLLEQAAEEYGFEHEGAVTIPCRPCELERILAAQQWLQDDGSSDDAGSWNSCDNSMVSQNYYS